MGMVERVEAAMRAKRLELIAMPLDRAWPEIARAAIAAMREPTEEMESAMSTEAYLWGLEGGCLPPKLAYMAAFVAALAEGEKG